MTRGISMLKNIIPVHAKSQNYHLQFPLFAMLDVIMQMFSHFKKLLILDKFEQIMDVTF